MKIIKIFLASSIEELSTDRLEIGDFFSQLHQIYSDLNVQLKLIKCEDYDNAIAKDGKQTQLDREIRDSELCFFLFFRKVGSYTRHEFEIALESFRNTEKPKIVTYFKYVNTVDEVTEEIRTFMHMLDSDLHHYYNTYNHIDTIKLGILMQIKLLKLDFGDLEIVDGALKLNGKVIAGTENIPMLSGNGELSALTEKKRTLQKKLTECRIAYLDDPSEENESAFFDASAKLNAVSKELSAIEKNTLELISTVAEITGSGKVVTYRQREALKYYNLGDYQNAERVLADSERENELTRAELRANSAKAEIEGYIEEDMLWIKAEIARGVTANSSKRIIEKYKKALDLIAKYDLTPYVLFDYASFLYNQNDFSEAIMVAESLKWHYSNPNRIVPPEKLGNLYNFLGMLYYDEERYEDSEREYLAALDIRKKLAMQDPYLYEQDLSMTYNNLGLLFSAVDKIAEAEEAYLTALGLRVRMAERNAEKYEQDLGRSLNNLGVFYSRIKRYEDSEAAHIKAFNIRKRLAEKYPEAFLPALARSYNNIGELYCKTNRYDESEKAHLSALEIRKKLASQNPEANESDLASSYNNLGGLYAKMKRSEAAEAAYLAALEIRKKLASKNSGASESRLAVGYNNLAMLYMDTKEYDRAKVAFNAELKILLKLKEKYKVGYDARIKETNSFLELLAKLD